MLAGPMDRRLTIERQTETGRDAMNKPVVTWATLTTRWANKRDVSDTEKFNADQRGATISTRFQLRHDSVTATITAKDRLVCEGRAYEIVGLPKEIADGRHVGIEITALAKA